MTLARGTDQLETARLLLRRIGPDDLPFFTRIHALPEVARGLCVNRHPKGTPYRRAKGTPFEATQERYFGERLLGVSPDRSRAGG